MAGTTAEVPKVSKPRWYAPTPGKFLIAGLAIFGLVAAFMTALTLGNPSGRYQSWTDVVDFVIERQTASIDERQGLYSPLSRLSAQTSMSDPDAWDGLSGPPSSSGAPTFVPLAPFIVNLSGDQGQRYLRLVAQVEVRGELAKDELEKHRTEVRNRLIFLLSSKTFADIGNTQGKYDLQAEITKNINEALDGPFIKKTYFIEFIVQ